MVRVVPGGQGASPTAPDTQQPPAEGNAIGEVGLNGDDEEIGVRVGVQVITHGPPGGPVR